jgi:hypothetical protein
MKYLNNIKIKFLMILKILINIILGILLLKIGIKKIQKLKKIQELQF